jgi:hypothetical protein
MRIFTLLFSLLFFTTVGYSQKSPINFDTLGIGANWTWTVFENATNPAVEIVNNPSATGINTSAKVAKFTALKAGQPYAGCESSHGTKDLGPFVLDSTNSTIKIMVRKPTISNVGIKLVSATGWAQPELKVANTKINEWEELTFDFSGFPNPPASDGKYDQIVIFPDFTSAARTQDNVIYFDNITFGKKTASSNEPTTAAPTPTRNAADVISLFSNAYTNVPVDTWRTEWSAAVLADITIAGNATKKYSALNFVGIETITKQVDISTMTHMHLDVWSPNITSLGVKLVDFGANGKYDGGGDDKEHQVDNNALAKGQWVALDIPISSFTGLTTKKNIAQLILVGQPSGATIIYVDNVYFYKGSTTVVETGPTTAAPTPTRAAADVISMYSNAYTNVSVDTWRTDWSSAILTDTMIQSNATKRYSKLDFVGIETVVKQMDISAMTHMHLDVWSPDFTSFGVKLVDFGANGKFDGGGDDKEHQVDINNPAKGQWVALDIPISSFSGLTTKKNIAQLILVGRPAGATTVYVDNVYFYKGTVVETGPTTAAPTPTRKVSEVISLFSNAYTNVPVDTWRTDWSSATLEEIQIQSNATKKYSKLDFVGIETVTKQVDISAMTHMHLDVWSSDFTQFGIKLVDFGANGKYDGGGDDKEHQVDFNAPAKGQWVALDIPIGSFTGLTTKKNIAQLILVGRPAGATTVFVDNVYFYNRPSATNNVLAEKVKIFPNPVRSGDVLKYEGDFENAEIYDIRGVKVLSLNNTQSSEIILDKGVFLLKVQTTSGEWITKKLIVQ